MQLRNFRTLQVSKSCDLQVAEKHDSQNRSQVVFKGHVLLEVSPPKALCRGTLKAWIRHGLALALPWYCHSIAMENNKNGSRPRHDLTHKPGIVSEQIRQKMQIWISGISMKHDILLHAWTL